MKIVFLDIDGVCNSTRSCIALGGYGHPDTDDKKLDPIALGLLLDIQKQTGCKFVISSTWRLNKQPSDFDFLGLDVIGCTPYQSKRGKERGYQIDDWLIEYYLKQDVEPIETYCIIDDDSDMLLLQMPFFVQTNHNNGFSFENYEQVLALFTNHDKGRKEILLQPKEQK